MFAPPPPSPSGMYIFNYRLHRELLTPKVLDEVLKLHLPLGLDIWAVHVRIEEDDGEGQDENGVGILELADQHRVTNTVPLTAQREKQ